MLLRAIPCGGVWDGFLPGQATKEEVPCRFCGGRDEMDICFGNALFSPFCMLGNFKSFFRSCPWIVAVGPVVFSGMAGCLVLVYMVRGTLGPPPLVGWHAVLWSAVLVLILLTILVSGPRLISGMWMILL